MIRTFLLILSLVFYINSVIAQETNDRTEIQEADTEAGAACTNFECLRNQYKSSSVEDIQLMCQKALPEYCKNIQEEHTVCSPTVEWAQGITQGTLYCISGLIEGVKDLVTGAIELTKATGRGTLAFAIGTKSFILDEKYRNEAIDTASLMWNHIADLSKEEVQEFIMNPIFGYIDEITNCLNAKGRWHYLCEGGIQTILGGGVAFKGVKTLKGISNAILFKPGKMGEISAKALVKNHGIKGAKEEIQRRLTEARRLKKSAEIEKRDATTTLEKARGNRKASEALLRELASYDILENINKIENKTNRK